MKLLLLVFAFGLTSCNSHTKDTTLNKEILSQVNYNEILDNSVVDGVPIEIINMGTIAITSGQIVACDPLVGFNAKPFLRRVELGNYPVKIYIAKTKDSGDRCALAKLEFSDKKAIKWVLAVTDDDKINSLKEDEYVGFPVDAGLGSFSDKNAFEEFMKFDSIFTKQNPGKNIYDDLLADEFLKSANKNKPDDIGTWVNLLIPNSKHNIMMFQSGYGDGVYPSYWGIDENGKVVSLVIDFIVLLE